ncbi:hypothetical protein KGQ20_26225 [Catenulispora sp. NF23]|uniref:Integral membrane protein n=1 Tax=Catenulispora pinistramenti TaxID=2705254 RepID=A0ABS5L398_9ACTN|nr:hypothetical protein [Catenulispora pinistramenti]MBS2536266.1 hypothetical protein [Catenulispora pinistramenti]MBS2552707.1 hypothetical protein [Catenulispora pinistramenti]
MEPRSVAPNSRAAVFAAVCTLLAVAAHRLMSVSDIPVTAIALGAAAVFCFARIAAALGERRLATIGLLVGGSQIGLHLLFQAAQAQSALSVQSVSSLPSGSAGTMSMPGMADIPAMGGMGGMPGMAGGSSSSFLGTTTGMTIAHVLAALVTAWWLRRGEAALFAVVQRAGTAGAVLGASWRMVAEWAAGVRPIRSAGPARSVVGVGIHRPAAARVLLFSVIRRGPPAAAVR